MVKPESVGAGRTKPRHSLLRAMLATAALRLGLSLAGLGGTWVRPTSAIASLMERSSDPARPLVACSSDADCDDGNPCTADRCVSAIGSPVCLHATRADGTSCSDGNACNGAETCQGGTCVAGGALDCDDGIRCTSDACDPTIGCIHDLTGCSCTVDADCDDGNPCNGTEQCALCAGCALHPFPCCSQGPTCMAGSAAPDGTQCDAGVVCEFGAMCSAGSCVCTPCPQCDDGDPCTIDTCAPDGCHHDPASGFDAALCRLSIHAGGAEVMPGALPTACRDVEALPQPATKFLAVIESRVSRARVLIEMSAQTGPRKGKARVLRAVRVLRSARQLALGRAARRRIPQECVAPLVQQLDDAIFRANRLAGTL